MGRRCSPKRKSKNSHWIQRINLAKTIKCNAPGRITATRVIREYISVMWIGHMQLQIGSNCGRRFVEFWYQRKIGIILALQLSQAYRQIGPAIQQLFKYMWEYTWYSNRVYPIIFAIVAGQTGMQVSSPYTAVLFIRAFHNSLVAGAMRFLRSI
jgi:hypothetical protein